MPELAEVEYFRKVWDAGLGKKVKSVAIHPKARLFRGIDTELLVKTLTGSTLRSSGASGKQMIFYFSTASLGIHLGMTGKLTVEGEDFQPGKHDHLVLFQAGRALVFTDFRLFGRVLFQEGRGEPDWWKERAPDVLSSEFSVEVVRAFLTRRKAAPIKAVLLDAGKVSRHRELDGG